MKKSNIIAATAAASILPFAALSFANAAEDYHMKVDRKLLQSSTGIAELHRDLDRQAREICESVGYNMREVSRFHSCKEDVLDIAIEKIDHSRLTGYHNSEGLSPRFSENR
ncbi:UrcA family protein [Aquisalinus flavus]|uniref:UrcA family protein n=1 Tax=Aquisalinus flavus TaxID=1526572 RepID=A0A8J2Y6I5_9PROT|nr:UrcA family protein [Aquisalinus flavus]MBD0426146.1 UrcA family protein [Aquisalinus flavus]UNE48273.1 UrcA family protein [Aquisalinus flavus]GGD10243.1 hypothetical protein GCM10011342_18930 [Aquisalinus flavus]